MRMKITLLTLFVLSCCHPVRSPIQVIGTIQEFNYSLALNQLIKFHMRNIIRDCEKTKQKTGEKSLQCSGYRIYFFPKTEGFPIFSIRGYADTNDNVLNLDEKEYYKLKKSHKYENIKLNMSEIDTEIILKNERPNFDDSKSFYIKVTRPLIKEDIEGIYVYVFWDGIGDFDLYWVYRKKGERKYRIIIISATSYHS